MNPPYIRHEAIPTEHKRQYAKQLKSIFGAAPPSRSNLFCYFLLKGMLDTKPEGLLCAIIMDSLQATAYGQSVLTSLTKHGTLIAERRLFAPFADVYADAHILLFRRRSGAAPKRSDRQIPSGYVPLDQLVRARRGLGLLNYRVFMAQPDDAYFSLAVPFVR